ncbi:fimbrial protein [Serratia marcescens VGH107]|nr:fimbrial protein [Serratia marcescens VGH107]
MSPIRYTLADNNEAASVGLGTAFNGAKIGGYTIGTDPNSFTVDGKTATYIRSTDNGKSWETGNPVFNIFYDAGAERLTSWSASGNPVPVAFTTMNATMGVQAYINKTSELDLTQPVKLDGLTTLEIVYL